MNYLTVIAKLKVKEGAIDFVKRELSKLVEPTLKEKGCINYDLFQDNEDPSVFLFYENWLNNNYLDAHMQTGHFKSCFEKIDGLYVIEVNKAAKVI